MITRIVLLFHPKLRQKMKSNHRTNMGLQEAWKFLHEADTFGVMGVLSNYQAPGEKLQKYLDPNSEEGKWLMNGFSEASRVQALLSLGKDDSTDIELKFFQKGKKSYTQRIIFSFSVDGKCQSIDT